MGSIRQAAIHTGLSYQKAWNMISTLEDGTGYKVVERRRDGKEEEGKPHRKGRSPDVRISGLRGGTPRLVTEAGQGDFH